jgi:hypothetical protein
LNLKWQIWSRAAVAAFRNDSSDVAAESSRVVFYVMSGILLRGSAPPLLPLAKKHVAVCVESTIYEIGECSGGASSSCADSWAGCHGIWAGIVSIDLFDYVVTHSKVDDVVLAF